MPDVDLKSPEVKAAIAAAVQEATGGLQTKIDEAVATATEGLKAKNTELLGEVKKFKTKAKVVPDDFDPEKWANLTQAEKLSLIHI